MIQHLFLLMLNAEYYKKNKPRIDWEYVMYTIIAIAVIAACVLAIMKGTGEI